MESRHVLVTGGAGYIGSRLVQHLLDAGHRVSVLDRCFFGTQPLASVMDQAGFRLIREDTRYFEPGVLRGVDVVMDLAGLANDPASDLRPEVTREINHGGAVRVARLAREAGVARYIFSSSCSIYGSGEHDSLDEDAPKNPVSAYAQSKIQAEADLLGLARPGFSVTLLRNATVYGLSPKMRFDLIVNVMTLYAFREGRIFIFGQGDQWRPLVHIDDVCRAFMMVMAAPESAIGGRAFNVGANEHNFRVIQVANMVKGEMPATELVAVNDDPDKRSYNVRFDRIASELGFRVTRSPLDGIREIHQALRMGRVEDTLRTRTLDFYRYLLEAEQVLAEVSYRGKVF